MAQSKQDKIREEAYKLWESDGCQNGKEMDYWLAAEQKISSCKSGCKKTKKPAVAAVKKPAAKKAASKKVSKK